METEERERLITAWITNAEARSGTAEHEESFWVVDRLWELIVHKADEGRDPNEVWEIILALNEHPLSDRALSLLAAGPLEDLLAYHGEELIERVEVQARRDPAFNRLLGGVWQNAMSEAVWERVKAARREVW